MVYEVPELCTELRKRCVCQSLLLCLDNHLKQFHRQQCFLGDAENVKIPGLKSFGLYRRGHHRENPGDAL